MAFFILCVSGLKFSLTEAPLLTSLDLDALLSKGLLQCFTAGTETLISNSVFIFCVLNIQLNVADLMKILAVTYCPVLS